MVWVFGIVKSAVCDAMLLVLLSYVLYLQGRRGLVSRLCLAGTVAMQLCNATRCSPWLARLRWNLRYCQQLPTSHTVADTCNHLHIDPSEFVFLRTLARSSSPPNPFNSLFPVPPMPRVAALHVQRKHHRVTRPSRYCVIGRLLLSCAPQTERLVQSRFASCDCGERRRGYGRGCGGRLG